MQSWAASASSSSTPLGNKAVSSKSGNSAEEIILNHILEHLVDKNDLNKLVMTLLKVFGENWHRILLMNSYSHDNDEGQGDCMMLTEQEVESMGSLWRLEQVLGDVKERVLAWSSSSASSAEDEADDDDTVDKEKEKDRVKVDILSSADQKLFLNLIAENNSGETVEYFSKLITSVVPMALSGVFDSTWKINALSWAKKYQSVTSMSESETQVDDTSWTSNEEKTVLEAILKEFPRVENLLTSTTSSSWRNPWDLFYLSDQNKKLIEQEVIKVIKNTKNDSLLLWWIMEDLKTSDKKKVQWEIQCLLKFIDE